MWWPKIQAQILHSLCMIGGPSNDEERNAESRNASQVRKGGFACQPAEEYKRTVCTSAYRKGALRCILKQRDRTDIPWEHTQALRGSPAQCALLRWQPAVWHWVLPHVALAGPHGADTMEISLRHPNAAKDARPTAASAAEGAGPKDDDLAQGVQRAESQSLVLAQRRRRLPPRFASAATAGGATTQPAAGNKSC